MMPNTIKSISSGAFSTGKLTALADFLDSRFKLPFIPLRFGWDFIFGLVPVAGDVVAALTSLYIIIAAVHHRARLMSIMRMIFNILLDFIIGLIPVAGDLFDAGWKANIRNVRLLMKDIDKRRKNRSKTDHAWNEEIIEKKT